MTDTIIKEQKYIFTVDWFSHNIPSWDIYLNNFKNKPNLNFLEIGSFQGRSTVWLLENILTENDLKIFVIKSSPPVQPSNSSTATLGLIIFILIFIPILKLELMC